MPPQAEGQPTYEDRLDLTQPLLRTITEHRPDFAQNPQWLHQVDQMLLHSAANYLQAFTDVPMILKDQSSATFNLFVHRFIVFWGTFIPLPTNLSVFDQHTHFLTELKNAATDCLDLHVNKSYTEKDIETASDDFFENIENLLTYVEGENVPHHESHVFQFLDRLGRELYSELKTVKQSGDVVSEGAENRVDAVSDEIVDFGERGWNRDQLEALYDVLASKLEAVIIPAGHYGDSEYFGLFPTSFARQPQTTLAVLRALGISNESLSALLTLALYNNFRRHTLASMLIDTDKAFREVKFSSDLIVRKVLPDLKLSIAKALHSKHSEHEDRQVKKPFELTILDLKKRVKNNT